MTITIPVWLLWTLGIGLGSLVLVGLGVGIAVFLMNRSGGWGPWQ